MIWLIFPAAAAITPAWAAKIVTRHVLTTARSRSSKRIKRSRRKSRRTVGNTGLQSGSTGRGGIDEYLHDCEGADEFV